MKFFFLVLSLFVSANALAARPVRIARAPARTGAPAAIDLPTTPAPSPASAASASSERRRSSPLNWDAFLDTELRIPNKEDLADKGFTVNDAALYISKDFTHGAAFVELPFYTTYGAVGNQFNFANQKAQGYIQTNAGPIGLRLGQYASFFGIEANDSKDRFFADWGLMKGIGVVPLTHTGGQVIWGVERVSVRGQFANPNSNGSLEKGSDPEFGANVRYDATSAFGSFGVEYGTVRANANGSSDKTNMLIEAMGGGSVDKFSFGGELDIRKAAGFDKTGFGIEGLGAFQMTDVLGLGARLDFIKDMPVVGAALVGPATAIIENGFELSVGPSYKLETDLTVRADLSVSSLKPLGADDLTIFGLSVSLVAHL